jgi:hypothetical protein
MVLSVTTEVFMPEIELANRYGSLAQSSKAPPIDLVTAGQSIESGCGRR